MSSPKISNRLKRLAELGVSSCDTVSEYAHELQELAQNTLSVEDAKRKSKVFKALADETRLRVMGVLAVREMCVCEIMVALGLTQPTASHHLGILENAGLVKDRKEGKWVFYSIADPRFVEIIRKLNVL
ncbi:MAG TPA: metalloregulator ArsR/SmtB family transcription factor [Candidatus Bathyarchaeia archaeon]|jgi:ArsR family transcriptional regulator|nr:metalloregulator ArsR/SmtB family transcription factor [Candidatus Bathyarchaeia archaeon]